MSYVTVPMISSALSNIMVMAQNQFIINSVPTMTSCTSNAINVYHNASGTAMINIANVGPMGPVGPAYNIRDIIRNLVLEDGHEARISLPDGTVVSLHKDGSHTITDADAKVLYRASRIRDFNPYLSVSDKVDEFIAYCGDIGVRQDEFMALPVKTFLVWLVLEAAKADGESIEDIKLLPNLQTVTKPRCASCGRFIKRKKAKLVFCSSNCFESAERVCQAA